MQTRAERQAALLLLSMQECGRVRRQADGKFGWQRPTCLDGALQIFIRASIATSNRDPQTCSAHTARYRAPGKRGTAAKSVRPATARPEVKARVT